MPAPGMFYNILQMDLENYLPVHAKPKCGGDDDSDRQRCGCLRTSEKLRHILSTFPAPPPPTPAPLFSAPYNALTRTYIDNSECISAHCKQAFHPIPLFPTEDETQMPGQSNMLRDSLFQPDGRLSQPEKPSCKTWRMVTDLVQLVQLTVTATALALYYLIYCYMQLVYYTLRSVLYFHRADGPMKITIGVVSVTSLVVAANVFMRLQKLVIFR